MFGWFSRKVKPPAVQANEPAAIAATALRPVVAPVLVPGQNLTNQRPQADPPSPPPPPAEILEELTVATRQLSNPSIPFDERLTLARKHWTDTLSILIQQLVLRQGTHADVLVDDLMKCRDHLNLDFGFKYPAAREAEDAALLRIDPDSEVDDAIYEAYEKAYEYADQLKQQELAAMLEPPFARTFWSSVADKCAISQFEIHMSTLMNSESALSSDPFSEPLSHYLQQFELWRPWYLLGTFSFLLHWREHPHAITQFASEIIRLEKLADAEEERAVRQEEEGREDHSFDWVCHKALRDYVADVEERLLGLAPDDYCGPDCPEYVRSFLMRDQTTGTYIYVINLAKAAVARLKKPPIDAYIAAQSSLPALSAAAIGIEFEQRLRAIVLNTFSGAEIQTTPVSGDQGADLLIRLGSVVVAIQAKRYVGVVGNAAVQEVFAAKQFYDADFAMVVTTSRYTQPAQILAAKLEVTLATEENFVAKLRNLLF